MNPWAIAGGIVGVGVLLAAGTALAGQSDDCEIDREYGFPYWLCAIMIRRCISDAGEIWLWDVAPIEAVSFGESIDVVEDWPERSLAFGQTQGERAANDAAIAWVDAHQDFVISGGERGPLAQRTEDFLAGLSPTEHADLQAVFDAIDPRIVGWVDELRVAPTDERYLNIGKSIAAVLQRADADALQADILAAIGWGHGLTLKGILDDAGVL